MRTFRTGLLIGSHCGGDCAAAITYVRYDTRTLKVVNRGYLLCGVNLTAGLFGARREG